MRYALRALCALGVLLLASAGMPRGATGTSAGADHEYVVPLAQDGSPAIGLRVTLGRLLGAHAFLLMEAMRTSDDVERGVLESALDENSDSLAEAISSIYGERVGRRFADVWDRHVGLLLDYGDAVASGDAESQRSAREGLHAYMDELGQLLAEVNPGLDPAQEAQALQAHIDQIAAFAEGDFADAYASHRIAFSHMFELGDHLALEIVRQHPEQFVDGAVAFSPRSDLQLALDQLLGEHMILAAQAMRAGVDGAPEFDAARASLDENSADLADAIAGIYGQEAGAQFGEVWREHTAAYLAFVQALGEGDDSERERSLGLLHSYHEHITQFLATANPRLDANAVADLIRRHVQALVTQAEATAAGDPARAIAATREGYDGTFEVGAALADAIALQFPNRFADLDELPTTDIVLEPGAWVPVLPLIAGLVFAASLWFALKALPSRRSARSPRSR
jgi:hypothetical protein